MADLEKIAKEQAVQGEKIENIERTCNKIEEHLIGNGTPGLMVRTDRLERTDAFKTKLFWIFFAAVVGLFIESVGFGWISSIGR